MIETLIKDACNLPEGDEKQNLVALICNHMRRDYINWNKDTIDDQKIADDLYELSNGKLTLTDSIARLMYERQERNEDRKSVVQGKSGAARGDSWWRVVVQELVGAE